MAWVGVRVTKCSGAITWHSTTFHNSALWIRITIYAVHFWAFMSMFRIQLETPKSDQSNRKVNGNPLHHPVGKRFKKGFNQHNFWGKEVHPGQDLQRWEWGAPELFFFFFPPFGHDLRVETQICNFSEIIEIFPFEVRDFPLLCYFYCRVILMCFLHKFLPVCISHLEGFWMRPSCCTLTDWLVYYYMVWLEPIRSWLVILTVQECCTYWVCLPQNAATCPSKMQHVECMGGWG